MVILVIRTWVLRVFIEGCEASKYELWTHQYCSSNALSVPGSGLSVENQNLQYCSCSSVKAAKNHMVLLSRLDSDLVASWISLHFTNSDWDHLFHNLSGGQSEAYLCAAISSTKYTRDPATKALKHPRRIDIILTNEGDYNLIMSHFISAQLKWHYRECTTKMASRNLLRRSKM